MNRYVLTPAAEDDVREILNYIERDNPSVLEIERAGRHPLGSAFLSGDRAGSLATQAPGVRVRTSCSR